jgi:hypothetical protein
MVARQEALQVAANARSLALSKKLSGLRYEQKNFEQRVLDRRAAGGLAVSPG